MVSDLLKPQAHKWQSSDASPIMWRGVCLATQYFMSLLMERKFCIYLHKYIYIYIHTYGVYMHVCMYMSVCAYIYTRMYIYMPYTHVYVIHINCIFTLRYSLLSEIHSFFYLLPSLYNKVCHGILSSFPHCTTNFSVANSEFAFPRRHFICPALRGMINHIPLLGYLRLFIYVRCCFGKMHYEEGIESWQGKLLCTCYLFWKRWRGGGEGEKRNHQII